MPIGKHRPDPGQQLFEQVYRRIRGAILAGGLEPGTPLSRRQLAAEFETSPLPVGQALLRLEAEGFVESRPRAGTRVRVPTADEIRGNYIVREALETHSARLFAELASTAQRRKLLDLAQRLDMGYASLAAGANRRQRHARLEKLHAEFHTRIAEWTGCSELKEAIERSRVLLFNWLFTLFSTSGETRPVPEHWHGRLAEVLVNGNPAAAAEAMRGHVRYRMPEVIASFERLCRDSKHPDRILRGPQRRTLAREKTK